MEECLPMPYLAADAGPQSAYTSSRFAPTRARLLTQSICLARPIIQTSQFIQPRFAMTDSKQPIAKDSVVSFHYTLTDTEGNTVETSRDSEPTVYLHG